MDGARPSRRIYVRREGAGSAGPEGLAHPGPGSADESQGRGRGEGRWEEVGTERELNRLHGAGRPYRPLRSRHRQRKLKGRGHLRRIGSPHQGAEEAAILELRGRRGRRVIRVAPVVMVVVRVALDRHPMVGSMSVARTDPDPLRQHGEGEKKGHQAQPQASGQTCAHRGAEEKEAFQDVRFPSRVNPQREPGKSRIRNRL